MIVNKYLINNPFDEIDYEIKFLFSKEYGLILNRLNYDIFGIIDGCFLISLIGESNLFHVYLGYKNGLFYAVKVMKRYKFDTKEVLNQRIFLFEREVELRLRLQRTYSHLVFIRYVNFENYIIYEDYCVNGKLNYYAESSMSEKLIRTIFLNVMAFLRHLNEGSRLFHSQISLDNVILNDNYDIKVIGLRHLNYSAFSSSVFYNSMSIVNEEEAAQITMLVTFLSKMLFKEDSERITPFLNSNLKIRNFNKDSEEETKLDNPLNSDFYLIDAEENENDSLKLIKLSTTTDYDNSKYEAKCTNDDDVFNSNMKLLSTVLDELISKHSLESSIRDKDSLKQFLLKLIKDRNLENIEFTSWYNGEIMDPFEYQFEMANLRKLNLEKNLIESAKKERRLISLKKGIFKVIK